MRRADKGDYPAWHNVRKSAKKLRYAMEFFWPCMGRGKNKRMKRLKKVQNRLGALNDAVQTGLLIDSHREVFADEGTLNEALATVRRERKRRWRAVRETLA
jgi:CHAD domain-containing protein